MKKKIDQDPREGIKTTLINLGRRYGLHKVFRDWVEMAAIAVSNSFDLAQFEKREERYLSLIKQYKELEERQAFPRMVTMLTLALERSHEDILGRIFEELELGNARNGQFFTPYQVSLLMAKLSMAPGILKEEIAEHGFFTMMEPCCGAGGMIIALAQAMLDEGINYQRSVHVRAIDIDPTCVHMTYLQCSLLGIPALIYRGNGLSDQMDEVWYTPMHAMGLWSYKLRRRGIDEMNISWWRGMEPAEKVSFLTNQSLSLEHLGDDRPAPAVLAARDEVAEAAD